MKQSLLTRLVLGALAGLAVSGAHAGQIQSSSVSVAREVITTDAQTINAPAASYRFAGDVDARIQTQTFQVQLKLSDAAKWATVGNASSIVVTDGVTGTIWTQNATAGAQTYQVIAMGKGKTTTDDDTLWVTFQVDTVAGKDVLKQPIITFNGAATQSTITNLYSTIVQPVANCDNSVKRLPVTFYHFTGLANPNGLAAIGNATPDEHARTNSQNEGTLITFPTNLNVAVTPSTYRSILTPGGNLNFSDAGGAGTSWIGANTVNLGQFKLVQQANGYDTNLTNVYALNTVALNGLRGIATAATNVGEVEADRIDVAVTATQGFVVGGTVFLSTAASNCAAAINAAASIPVTAANAAGPITVPLNAAGINAAALTATGAGAVQVCYTVPGTTVIPSSNFAATATVVKAAAGANLNEQNNACNGNLYSLGGGLKIDVRNYASSKETSGYQSVIRLINNSDSVTADVWAQIIHQDGKMGAWGKLVDLPARGIKNLTAAQIEALLVNAPDAGAANNGASAAAASTDGAPRLRITSKSGKSLRVQNYLFNSATGQILEGSNSQGVDYEGNNILRAPTNDGQYISQDANSGLNLAK